jgi:hypothetical protein
MFIHSKKSFYVMIHFWQFPHNVTGDVSQLTKSFRQFLIVIFDALVAAVIREQAEREAVGVAVLDDAVTAFRVVWARRGRTGAFYYGSAWTRHNIYILTPTQS